MFASLILFCSILGAFAQSSSSSSSLSSSYSSSNSRPLYNGPCPQIFVDPIDYNKYSGKWYEVQRSTNNYNENSDVCHLSLWSKPLNHKSRVIHKSYSHSASVTSTTLSDVIHNDQATSFIHHFPTVGDVSKNYYALDTKYDDYTIVWTCDAQGENHYQRSWVFSRKPGQPKNIENLKRRAFARYNLDVPRMIYHDFSDCDQILASYG